MKLPEGYLTEPGFDPAEDHIGPFFYRETGGGLEYAFVAEDRHCNVTGIVHGGVLMTFADYSLCMEATDHYAEEDCVTVSFSCEFPGAARLGDLIECRACVSRKTGALVFVTGQVAVRSDPVLDFSAVVKRLRRQPKEASGQ